MERKEGKQKNCAIFAPYRESGQIEREKNERKRERKTEKQRNWVHKRNFNN